MKIICIGRNYESHTKELGNIITKEPIFFLKPDTAIQPKGHPFFIPNFSNNIQYEVDSNGTAEGAYQNIKLLLGYK